MSTSRCPAETQPLLSSWRRAWTRARVRTVLGALMLSIVFGALVARAGTPRARLTATALFGGVLITWIVLRVLMAWVVRDSSRELRTAVRWVGSPVSEAAARACKLITPSSGDAPLSMTQQLARLHLTQVLADVSPHAVRRQESKWSSLSMSALLICTAIAVGTSVFQPAAILEGLNVWVSQDGRAPLAMRWTSPMLVRYEAPRHTGGKTGLFVGGTAVVVPQGTQLTVRTQPLFEDTRLVLLVGQQEVAFTSDGRGTVTAQVRIMKSSRLDIAARFGDVLVLQQPDTGLTVRASMDAPPTVTLQGTPGRRQIRPGTRVTLDYDASDDYGLRAIQLRMTCAGRVANRNIATLSSARRTYQDVLVLKASDKFLTNCHTPITVVVRASDNDSVIGSKWGKSGAMILEPPPLGQQEADRFERLRRTRSLAVDQLALQLTAPAPKTPRHWSAWTEQQNAREQVWLTDARRVLDEPEARPIPPTLQRYLRDKIDRVHKKILRCASTSLQEPCRHAARAWLDETTRAIFAWDMGIRALAHRDVRRIAKKMNVDATSLVRALGPSEQDHASAVPDALLDALSAAAGQLGRMEGLGMDLARVVKADVARVRRGLDRGDRFHARLAAQDLVARLRRPDMSFLGGGGGGTSTEAGSRHGAGNSAGELPPMLDDPDGSRASERLAHDHRDLLEKLDKALAEALSPKQRRKLREHARRHAEHLRRAVKPLPSVSASADTPASHAARARAHALRMASSLERLAWLHGLQQGKAANAELAAAMGDIDPDVPLRGKLGLADRAVTEERKWIQEQLKVLRDAMKHKGKALSEEERQLAERAKDLIGQGRSGKLLIPDAAKQALEQANKSMQGASKKLSEGNGVEALELMEGAQQMLEMASGSERARDQDSPSDGDQGVGQDGPSRSAGGEDVPIPDKDAFQGPAVFRRRVQRGLRTSADPRWRPALRRYVEGLLQ